VGDDLPSPCLHPVHGDATKKSKVAGWPEKDTASCFHRGLLAEHASYGQHEKALEVGDGQAASPYRDEQCHADHRRPPVFVDGTTSCF
jgi:hypothetical protein